MALLNAMSPLLSFYSMSEPKNITVTFTPPTGPPQTSVFNTDHSLTDAIRAAQTGTNAMLTALLLKSGSNVQGMDEQADSGDEDAVIDVKK